MAAFDMSIGFPAAESEKDLLNWVKSFKTSSVVRHFTLDNSKQSLGASWQAPEPSRIKLWAILFFTGSGINYVSAFIFRESSLPSGNGIIRCVATSHAALFGELQFTIDEKNRTLKIYGSPNKYDQCYPQPTPLMEYCFGKLLF